MSDEQQPEDPQPEEAEQEEPWHTAYHDMPLDDLVRSLMGAQRQYYKLSHAIYNKHIPTSEGICKECLQPWHCPTIDLVSYSGDTIRKESVDGQPVYEAALKQLEPYENGDVSVDWNDMPPQNEEVELADMDIDPIFDQKVLGIAPEPGTPLTRQQEEWFILWNEHSRILSHDPEVPDELQGKQRDEGDQS